MTVEELAKKDTVANLFSCLVILKVEQDSFLNALIQDLIMKVKILIWLPILISASVEEMWWMYRII